MNPEEIHLAINHLPFLGSGFAAILIIAGIFLRNRALLLIALATAAVSGWMTPLVMETGEQAYERYEEGPVRRYLDPDFENSLEIHEDRAETWSKLMVVSALLSTLTFALAFRQYEAARKFAFLAALLCLASLFSGIWIADSGGKIRRPDFRDLSVESSTAPIDAPIDYEDDD